MCSQLEDGGWIRGNAASQAPRGFRPIGVAMRFLLKIPPHPCMGHSDKPPAGSLSRTKSVFALGYHGNRKGPLVQVEAF